MKDNNIGSRPFYPPLHAEPAYGYSGSYPVTEEISQKGLWLPSSVALTDEQVNPSVGNQYQITPETQQIGNHSVDWRTHIIMNPIVFNRFRTFHYNTILEELAPLSLVEMSIGDGKSYRKCIWRDEHQQIIKDENQQIGNHSVDWRTHIIMNPIGILPDLSSCPNRIGK